ncbi:MAG: L-ribulose-5-phosphate 3-epimerase [Tissierellia bacterium]|nr:L-ribulose-5-phosphate 3-epimerase [Tissierellia bacterium]
MDYTLGIYEKALPDDLSWQEKFEICKEYGYDFLEISIDESDKRLARLEWSKEERLDLLTVSRKLGVPFGSMCLSGHRKYPLGSKDPQVRERSLDIAQKAIDLAVDLGIRIIQLAGYDVYYEESTSESKKYFLENLSKITYMAAAKGVALAFETMETEFMDTVKKAMVYVEKIDSPYLGIYPDCGNLNNASILYGSDYSEDFQAGKGHIFALHLKETKPGLYRNMLFGQGRVDFDQVIFQARKQGINRFVTEFWYLGNENYLDDVRHQSSFMREKLDGYFKEV